MLYPIIHILHFPKTLGKVTLRHLFHKPYYCLVRQYPHLDLIILNFYIVLSTVSILIVNGNLLCHWRKVSVLKVIFNLSNLAFWIFNSSPTKTTQQKPVRLMHSSLAPVQSGVPQGSASFRIDKQWPLADLLQNSYFHLLFYEITVVIILCDNAK